MPELPEVETTVRAINKFEKNVLKEIIVNNKNLRWIVEEKVEELLKNKLIQSIARRAKYILIYFEDYCLMIHLGMSGKLRIQKIKDNYFKKHDHVELIFENEKIVFNDPRRFGSIHLTRNPHEHRLIKNLGIEPLSKSFNKNYLAKLCKNSNLNIKKLIMDQRKIVGVGNIVIRVFCPADSPSVAESLRKDGHGVTVIDGEGKDGPVKIYLCVIPRRKLKEVLNTIQEINPNTYVTTDMANPTSLRK